MSVCHARKLAIFNLSVSWATQDAERLQLRSQDLEHQLFSKEKELEQLFQKQKRVGGCVRHVVPQVELQKQPFTRFKCCF